MQRFEYKYISADSVEELAAEMNIFGKEGWRALGSPSVTEEGYNAKHYILMELSVVEPIIQNQFQIS